MILLLLVLILIAILFPRFLRGLVLLIVVFVIWALVREPDPRPNPSRIPTSMEHVG